MIGIVFEDVPSVTVTVNFSGVLGQLQLPSTARFTVSLPEDGSICIEKYSISEL